MKRLLLSVLTLALMVGLACSKTDAPKDPDVQPQAADAGGQAVRPDVQTDTPKDPAQAEAPKPKGETVDGKKTGSWTYFNAEGGKAAEGPYENDLKHGQWTYWYTNGKKAAEGMYSKGEKTGAWKSWDETGVEITKQVFVEGLRPAK